MFSKGPSSEKEDPDGGDTSHVLRSGKRKAAPTHHPDPPPHNPKQEWTGEESAPSPRSLPCPLSHLHLSQRKDTGLSTLVGVPKSQGIRNCKKYTVRTTVALRSWTRAPVLPEILGKDRYCSPWVRPGPTVIRCVWEGQARSNQGCFGASPVHLLSSGTEAGSATGEQLPGAGACCCSALATSVSCNKIGRAHV